MISKLKKWLKDLVDDFKDPCFWKPLAFTGVLYAFLLLMGSFAGDRVVDSYAYAGSIISAITLCLLMCLICNLSRQSRETQEQLEEIKDYVKDVQRTECENE